MIASHELVPKVFSRAALMINALEVAALLGYLNGRQIPTKVLIGGVPVTRSFARQIGADGYSRNASIAVETAKKLVGKAA